MQRQKTDIELVREFNAGKEDGFAELVDRYSSKVYHLATRFVRDDHDAEEVLQDVFVTVFRKLRGFEGRSSFSSWLYRVTVNAALMKLRKRNQERAVALEDLEPQVAETLQLQLRDFEEADQAAYRRELTRALELAVMQLPDDYRPVFVMRDVDGLTSKEVAQILGLSVPAVKSRLHRSRLMLRDWLLPIYEEYRRGTFQQQRAVGE